jgi:hypothetical protein
LGARDRKGCLVETRGEVILGELFVEFFDLVDPGLQLAMSHSSVCTVSSYSVCSRRSSAAKEIAK